MDYPRKSPRESSNELLKIQTTSMRPPQIAKRIPQNPMAFTIYLELILDKDLTGGC